MDDFRRITFQYIFVYCFISEHHKHSLLKKDVFIAERGFTRTGAPPLPLSGRVRYQCHFFDVLLTPPGRCTGPHPRRRRRTGIAGPPLSKLNFSNIIQK